MEEFIIPTRTSLILFSQSQQLYNNIILQETFIDSIAYDHNLVESQKMIKSKTWITEIHRLV